MESCSGVGLLAPLPEILVTSAPIGEVRRQHSPLAAAFQEIQHAAENVIQVHDAGLGPASGRLQRGQNTGELLPTEVTGIRMRHDYPSPDNSLNLTYVRDCRQVLRSQLRVHHFRTGPATGLRHGGCPRPRWKPTWETSGRSAPRWAFQSTGVSTSPSREARDSRRGNLATTLPPTSHSSNVVAHHKLWIQTQSTGTHDLIRRTATPNPFTETTQLEIRVLLPEIRTSSARTPQPNHPSHLRASSDA